MEYYNLLKIGNKDPLLKSFLSKKEHANLVKATFENPSKENYELLDSIFKDFYLRTRIISYFAKFIRFEAKHYDSNLRRHRRRFLLLLDDTNVGDNFISIDTLTKVEEIHYKSLEDYIENPVLFNAIKTLTEHQKKILFLSYAEGFKDTEIARNLQVSQQSITKSRNNALAKLRSVFNE